MIEQNKNKYCKKCGDYIRSFNEVKDKSGVFACPHCKYEYNDNIEDEKYYLDRWIFGHQSEVRETREAFRELSESLKSSIEK